nr:MAG TPA: hypothetical protein [Caudoviricetes sp.]
MQGSIDKLSFTRIQRKTCNPIFQRALLSSWHDCNLCMCYNPSRTTH